ncbi:putative methyltransferase [Desulfamplus magnetovallimortis]|uniref:Ribosomal RNA small subunit methyltransferase I n=1 Tax=Desulfamplus magnetovallimortis TaxID=1246637 RepID=A0A1W1H633_9BACT|nr:16S rRNA (cytidine(1402)-2'-O)-methyltransferase [Desulfamplus magnetovallimortis]SLM27939.1 putative methyltransferase [Desulfamplus magnetovallimortis]
MHGFNVESTGILYIVATPIGNLEDITLRALRILREADVIAAEDTRHTGKLLNHYQIRKPLISCHEHNEEGRIPELVDRLSGGESIALVSDAGTPSVSDPGYRLVAAAVSANISVIPVPGPCAAVAALSVSGLSTDSFHFVGFLHKKKGARIRQIESLKDIKATIIFYESPKRIISLLQELALILGDRPAVVAREITKIHEEYVRGTLVTVAGELEERTTIKGECVLMVGWQEAESCKGDDLSSDEIDQYILKELEISSLSKSKLAKEISNRLSLSRQDIYSRIVKLGNSFN